MTNFLQREQIERLPKRASVAFAARCARRVQILFDGSKGATGRDWRIIDSAITAAERIGFDHSVESSLPRNDVAELAKEAREVFDRARQTLIDKKGHRVKDRDPDTLALVAVMETATAAFACAEAAGMYLYGKIPPNLLTSEVYQAIKGTINGLSATDANEFPSLNNQVNEDFSRLLSAATDGSWNDDTPVPLDLFDPLNVSTLIEPIEFLIDPGSAPPEKIGELFSELSELYRLLGGDSDLEFRVEDCRTPAMEEAS